MEGTTIGVLGPEREAGPASLNPSLRPRVNMPDFQAATLGSGCFWCSEAVYSELLGVVKVEPGYSGGTVPNPSYEQVCADNTGHAEVAQVTFDPNTISYRELLEVFFSTHDPTTLNRQGGDEGTQYRSVIFYVNADQKLSAEKIKAAVEKSGAWPRRVVTEIVPASEFFKAEEYHQNYYGKNPDQPYCKVVISPKIQKIREEFGKKLK
jgi:peptide-methionine (S)-S-oxide reductase